MANHKWKDEYSTKVFKQESCVKCGVFREWYGGDMQCWVYEYPKGHEKYTSRKIFKRPECE